MPSTSEKSFGSVPSTRTNGSSISSLNFKGLATHAIDSLKQETRAAIAEAKEQSVFLEWSSEDLRCLLAEQGVAIRGGDRAPRETLIRLCDAVFQDDEIPPRPATSTSTEDRHSIESAALVIQTAFIARKDGKRDEKTNQQHEDDSNACSSNGEDLSEYLEEQLPILGNANVTVRQRDYSARQVKSPEIFRPMSMLQRLYQTRSNDSSNGDDSDDEELDVEWRKPSYRYAKRHDASSRPNRDGNPYDWRKITLGRHCTYAGCGEQLDLWDEGTTSELSQHGSGITNYFKYLKWCCWVMMVVSILHLPVLIINVLGGSLQYNAGNAASTTFGNLGSADDVVYVRIPGCELADFAAGDDACTISKDQLAVFFAWLDTLSTVFVIVAWIWLKRFQSKEADSLNRSTVTSSDYTICVRGIDPETTEEELEAHFQGIVGDKQVAEVHLAFANSEEISLYFKRGKLIRKRYDCIQRIRYERTAQLRRVGDYEPKKGGGNNKGRKKRLNKLLDERQDLTDRIRLADEEREKAIKDSGQTNAVQGYVTFQTESAFIHAVSAYQISWIQSLGCCYPIHLRLRGRKVRISQAPEPSTIQWENLEYSSRSRFFRKCLTAAIALVAVCVSIAFTFLARDFRAKTLEATARPCPGGYYDLDTEQQRDIVAQDIDLAHCYCETLGLYEQWGVSLCSDYLSVTLKSNFMSYGAGFLVVFMNMLFTMLFDRSGSFEKHESLEAMERSNMIRVFLLKFVNTGTLVLLYNQIWLQSLMNIRIDNAPEFDVQWYSTGGVSLIIVISLNAITPHIVPVVRYLLHRSKVRRLERHLTDESDTSDEYKVFFTQEDLNAYVGSNAKFCLNYRYTQSLVTFCVCWMYGLSMPLLLIIGALSFFLSYWIDKWLFCNFYKTPPLYSDSMGRTCTTLIGVAVVVHLIMSMWTLGTNDKIFHGLDAFFMDENGPLDLKTGALTALVTKAMQKQHLLILETLLLIYLAGLVLSRFSAGVGGCFQRCCRCLFCQATSTQAQKLSSTMNTVQIDYSSAIHRGVIKGLASYNILKNPKYQEAFGISPEFADQHKRLSSIRGLNTKEGGMV